MEWADWQIDQIKIAFRFVQPQWPLCIVEASRITISLFVLALFLRNDVPFFFFSLVLLFFEQNARITCSPDQSFAILKLHLTPPTLQFWRKKNQCPPTSYVSQWTWRGGGGRGGFKENRSRSAPEKGLYCKPKYQANFKIYFSYSGLFISTKLTISAVRINLSSIFCIWISCFRSSSFPGSLLAPGDRKKRDPGNK